MNLYDKQLWEAYKSTELRGDTPRGEVCIRVDEIHLTLDLLLQDYETREWAYITAFNPGSTVQAVKTNERRHEELIQMTDESGHRHFPGRGVGKDPDWEPEESLLIIGLGRDDAISIGWHFGQNTVVCGVLGLPIFANKFARFARVAQSVPNTMPVDRDVSTTQEFSVEIFKGVCIRKCIKGRVALGIYLSEQFPLEIVQVLVASHWCSLINR